MSSLWSCMRSVSPQHASSSSLAISTAPSPCTMFSFMSIDQQSSVPFSHHLELLQCIRCGIWVPLQVLEEVDRLRILEGWWQDNHIGHCLIAKEEVVEASFNHTAAQAPHYIIQPKQKIRLSPQFHGDGGQKVHDNSLDDIGGKVCALHQMGTDLHALEV